MAAYNKPHPLTKSASCLGLTLMVVPQIVIQGNECLNIRKGDNCIWYTGRLMAYWKIGLHADRNTYHQAIEDYMSKSVAYRPAAAAVAITFVATIGTTLDSTDDTISCVTFPMACLAFLKNLPRCIGLAVVVSTKAHWNLHKITQVNKMSPLYYLY